jgi:hypothetical protein
MVLSVIFLEDKHNILLHLSIFYEYQQFLICSFLVFTVLILQCLRHTCISIHSLLVKNIHRILLRNKVAWWNILFFYFMSINSFFNTVSVSRYSRPIAVTRDPL